MFSTPKDTTVGNVTLTPYELAQRQRIVDHANPYPVVLPTNVAIQDGVSMGVGVGKTQVHEPAWSTRRMKQTLAGRLHIADGERFPFDFIELHKTNDKVIVFLVVNGEPVVLTDGAELFPSDQLITQLRLIK